MNDPKAYMLWKVVANDPANDACTFDACLVFHDRIDMPPEQLMLHAQSPKGSYFNHPVPFEQALPEKRPFTLVVRARGASTIAVSVEHFDGDGATGSGHWRDGSSAIIVYAGSGSVSTSLPDKAID